MKIIHLTRDPRAIISSLKKLPKNWEKILRLRLYIIFLSRLISFDVIFSESYDRISKPLFYIQHSVKNGMKRRTPLHDSEVDI